MTMINKITQQEIAEMFGYNNKSSFFSWKKVPERKERYEWLKVSAILIKNGFSTFEVLGMADKLQRQKAEIAELNKTINDHCDKVEALKESIR